MTTQQRTKGKKRTAEQNKDELQIMRALLANITLEVKVGKVQANPFYFIICFYFKELLHLSIKLHVY